MAEDRQEQELNNPTGSIPAVLAEPAPEANAAETPAETPTETPAEAPVAAGDIGAPAAGGEAEVPSAEEQPAEAPAPEAEEKAEPKKSRKDEREEKKKAKAQAKKDKANAKKKAESARKAEATTKAEPVGKGKPAGEAQEAKEDKKATQPRPPKPKPDPEVVRQRREEKARASRRRSRQLIGFALSILIVVGAVSIINWGVDTVAAMLDSEEERMEYQRLFEPMVWYDILPFESVSQVDENNVKLVSLWGILNDKQDQLERNDMGEPLVTVADVDQYAAQLFGPDFRFSGHETFYDPIEGLTYTFDEDAQAYVCPVTGIMPRFLANVMEIHREGGGIKRVVMGYVATRTGDDQVIAAPDYEHPTKFMDFMLRRDGGEFYLYAILPNTTYTVETAAASSVPAAETSLPPASESVAEAASEGLVASQPEEDAQSEEPQPEDSQPESDSGS